jgi:hypothetical protein
MLIARTYLAMTLQKDASCILGDLLDVLLIGQLDRRYESNGMNLHLAVVASGRYLQRYEAPHQHPCTLLQAHWQVRPSLLPPVELRAAACCPQLLLQSRNSVRCLLTANGVVTGTLD